MNLSDHGLFSSIHAHCGMSYVLIHTARLQAQGTDRKIHVRYHWANCRMLDSSFNAGAGILFYMCGSLAIGFGFVIFPMKLSAKGLNPKKPSD